MSGTPKGGTNCCVAAWDRHSNNFGNSVESNVVDAKAPNKFLNVSNIFLVRLGSKQGLGKPSTFKDLVNMSKLEELCNSFLDNRKLKRTKRRVLAGNRPCITSVSFALIVLNRDRDAFFTEDAPVLLDEILQCRLLGKG